MKILLADDNVTGYEVCTDFGVFLCEDEEPLRFTSWDEANAFIKGLLFAARSDWEREKLLEFDR